MQPVQTNSINSQAPEQITGLGQTTLLLSFIQKFPHF